MKKTKVVMVPKYPSMKMIDDLREIIKDEDLLNRIIDYFHKENEKNKLKGIEVYYYYWLDDKQWKICAYLKRDTNMFTKMSLDDPEEAEKHD